MSTQMDPLNNPQAPDRVFYANGALLDQEDFTLEQTYHRGRMGRALAYLHGSGTVAGLEVIVEKREEETLIVHPGMAIDRLGRMIEVPRSACLRLGRWLEDQLADPKGYDRLSNSFRTGSSGQPDGVVVDVFIKFEVCERGKQPAFATGNFDALDAIAPSRLRDSYRLEMVIREEATLPVPDPGFPDLTGMTPAEIKKRVITYKLQEAWKESTDWKGPGDTLLPLPEHVPEQGQDGTEVMLARLLIPMIETTNPPGLKRNSNGGVIIDNTLRRFIYSTAELVWLAGILR